MRARIVMIIMAVALMALPAMAQDWQSTSTMQGTGSSYAPQVTAVGAATVTEMATTTESYTPARGPRRAKMDESGDAWGTNQDAGQTNDNSSPIGDAVLPLMLMAMLFAGVVYTRRKKALNR